MAGWNNRTWTGCNNLIPIDSPGDHKYVPEQYVVEKAADGGDDNCEVRRVGVVKTVNEKERTAFVRWLKPVARAEDPQEFDKEEIVSGYELEGHADYDYCYGDVVVRLSPVSVPPQTLCVGGSVEVSSEIKLDVNKHSWCKKVEDASGDEASLDFTDLSWVGNITGLKNGDFEVTWADGMVSTKFMFLVEMMMTSLLLPGVMLVVLLVGKRLVVMRWMLKMFV